jgi:serine protease AprX
MLGKNIVYIIVCTALLLVQNIGNAQAVYGYRIKFSNKIGSPTVNDASTYLSTKALARRLKYNITITDNDRPVNTIYIDSVYKLLQGIRVHNISKWFNQCVILSENDNAAILNNIAFVDTVQLVAYYPNGWVRGKPQATPSLPNYTTIPKVYRSDSSYYGASFKQIKLTNTHKVHQQYNKGEQAIIAVLDAGFQNIFASSHFDSLINNGNLLDYYNYVGDTTNIDSFSNNNTHGVDVLSTMAANIPGSYVGSAPNATYVCYITEDANYESPIEEDNYISGLERADSIGADIVNASLSYGLWDSAFVPNNYTYITHFTGNTTLLAKAVNTAVAKGIFVVLPQGNNGGAPINTLYTPADATYGYTVGAVDTFAKYATGSAKGPNAIGQVKPDGMGIGVGVAIIDKNDKVLITGGTSFSAPTLAGAIACIIKAYPNITPIQLKQLIIQHSSRYNSASDTMGYGIPNFEAVCQAAQLATNLHLNIADYNEILLYPNPAQCTVQLTHTSANALYTISNVQGQIVLEGIYKNGINIQQIPTGQYWIRVINNNKLWSACFYKQ